MCHRMAFQEVSVSNGVRKFVFQTNLNAFIPNGIFNCYQLDQSISILRVVG